MVVRSLQQKPRAPSPLTAASRDAFGGRRVPPGRLSPLEENRRCGVA